MLFIPVCPAASISLALLISAGLTSTSAKPWSVQYDHREILHTFRTEDSKSNQLWLPAPQGDLHVLRVQVLIVIVFDGDPSLRHGVLMRSGFQNRRRKTLAALDIVWI